MDIFLLQVSLVLRVIFAFDFFIGRGYFLVAGFAGTPGYLSPEVLRKDPYGKPVDVWACGKDGNYTSDLLVI